MPISDRARRWLAAARAFDWTLPARGIFVFWAGGLALLGFTVSWWLLSFDSHFGRPDVGFYQGVGEAIARGLVPYRDFDPVYPPAALPILGLPSLLGAQPGRWETYAVRFEHLMLLVGWLLVLAVLFSLVALGSSRRRVALGLGFMAISPLLVGATVVARYDLWPAALTTAALGAVLAGRGRLGSAGLGVAIMAKVYPVVFVPLVLLYLWRRSGVRAASLAGLSTIGGAALASMPFLVIAPQGMWSSLVDFTSRPLQVESSGAAILWIAHIVGDVPISILASFGSDNLVGPLPSVMVTASSLVLAIALAAIWLRFARQVRPSPDDLALAAVAAVCAFVLFGKVLSGQYLIWLIPLVALLRGTRGVSAAVLLGTALVLTQQWYPSRYPAWVYGLDDSVAWLVAVRDLTIGALFVTLAAPAGWAVAAREWLGRLTGPRVRPALRPAAAGGGAVAAQPAFMRLERPTSKD
jgi:hypothetical protein